MEKQKKGVIEKTINLILNVFITIFSIILLISIYNNLQVKLFGKDYSDFFGYSLFEVQTGSMSPEINSGDWIIVKASKNIKLKDVITYRQDGEFITHRVIGTYNSTYVTKGDANNSKDDPIDQNQIVGKVVKILPNFGLLKKTIFNPTVLAAIIITILISSFIFKKNNKEKTLIEENKIINIIKEKINILKSKLMKLEPKKEILTTKLQNIKEKLKEQSVQIIKKHSEKGELEDNIQLNQETKASEEPEIVIEESKKIELNDDEFDDIPSFIPVDASELDETFLEIAQNEIEDELVITKKEEFIEDDTEEPITTTKINLELLEKGKKSKNLIDKFISVKLEEINEIINILNPTDKALVNEPTIKNKLLSSYIDAKYYNYYGNVDLTTHKKQNIKIQKYLEESSTILKKKYNGSDSKFNDKVNKYYNIFITILNLEQAKESILDKKAKEEYYKKELSKYCNSDLIKLKEMSVEIMKIQRNYIGIIDYLLKKIETNMFNLEFNKLKVNKNICCLNLEHNISFSKIYSDYIIDRTYNEGVIAENKTIITLNLLSVQLVKDMINGDFNKKYILYIPKSLYSKAKKLERILKMIDDEHAKESVVILMDLETLIKYKAAVKKLKKDGYQVSIALTSETSIDSKYYSCMELVESIYVDKNIPNIIKKLSVLPEDLADKLIYENVIENIGDFGGEE